MLYCHRDYHADYVEELVPRWHFKWEGTQSQQAELFFGCILP
jgi:hypothetical protein